MDEKCFLHIFLTRHSIFRRVQIKYCTRKFYAHKDFKNWREHCLQLINLLTVVHKRLMSSQCSHKQSSLLGRAADTETFSVNTKPLNYQLWVGHSN